MADEISGMNSGAEQDSGETPWEAAWPKDGLEQVDECPACGDRAREKIYDRLIDNAFRFARGEWQMWRCDRCGSGYLDPRPTPEAIGDAYGNYYTHDVEAREDFGNLGLIRRVRRLAVNGYKNREFGSRAEPRLALGQILKLLPSFDKSMRFEYRHLPPRSSGNAKLLDIGCGNGFFLLLASECGWDVRGVDPDESAVASARQKGLDVTVGDVFAVDPREERFEYITMSHVIEHVHDPIAVMKRVGDLLEIGGRLWLQTPNFNAPTHASCGSRWRGLEAPRHLCILTFEALENLCQAAGLAITSTLEKPGVAKDILEISRSLPVAGSPSPLVPLISRGPEFLTIIAERLR
ncbi:class I SAM-dependent methyltransferase [Sphingomonas sp. LY160]|uniref:class I SAM-dependent methyltransferase n=1 Tax=Sphingomonas sp. LY160 TaxID=3095342 RepID=UPI002ADEE744|nr:class I SAM-dependent methyltransferase [Sphingomonas sp. LY160]MEA1071028.1 class I SAM-dependent methyltransferase [Sphingomonas sp. LY160]